MTSTNVLSMGASKTVHVRGSIVEQKRRGEDEMASVFSSLMNQMASQKNPVTEDITLAKPTVSKTTDAYESYRYKDNAIEQADNSGKLEENAEDVTQFEEDVVTSTAEEFGVPEDAVKEALADLGYNVFDLLDPQKLADVVMRLSGMGDQTELLLSPEFQELFNEIGQMGSELMESLGMSAEEFETLTLAMQQMPEGLQEEVPLTRTEILGENVSDQPVIMKPEVEADVLELLPQEEDEAAGLQQRPVEVTVEQAEAEAETVQPKEYAQTDSGNLSQGESHMGEQAILTAPNQEMAEIPQTPQEVPSYTSVDTMDIIRQIADSVKLIVGTETTSIEMQLNPENLGKIYLHISEKEGIVHAQLAAQNEVVREALEVQAATLRENLNQAGVKVDAIEVTVATHEFEQNLEQNQKREERQEQEREGNRTGRRNLHIDSLDELSGMMTEEEALVAQMMRDNGNSVDLTA